MAPPNEPPTHITFRIKVPPGYMEGGADTFTLPSPVAVATRIGGVRELIQASLPSNPPPERQRLLYSGRALVDNDQSVAEALNIRRDPSQTEYVVHLLVRGVDNASSAPRTATPPGQVPPQHGLAQHFQQHQQQVLQQNQHLHGVPAPFQPEVLLAQARVRQEQLQAELSTLQAQARVLHTYRPGAGMPDTRPDGEQLAPSPVAPSQQPQAQPQQAQSQAYPQQAQPNVPPVPGQPRTQNVFIQGVGPNGERIAVHHQQRVFQHNIPIPNNLPPGGHGLPAGALGIPPLGMQNQQPQARSSSPALDRVREQIADLRRLLEETRAEHPPEQVTPEQNARIAHMEEQMSNINNYIDPLNLASRNGNENGINQPADSPRRYTRTIPPYLTGHADIGQPPMARRYGMRRPVRVPPPANPDEVTCYLLSDPTGHPQALLMTPQRGTYTGTLQNNVTPSVNANAQAPPVQPAVAHAVLDPPQVVRARQLAARGNVVAVNPMALFLRHFWLLLRMMIFSYFLLGSNMGWRTPLALGAIAFGFWLMRAGMLGDGGVVRGWWDDIVREGAAAVEPAWPAGEMPTPEEVARRLMEERRRGEGEWVRWGRERVRAVVLLLASLWPGVGEAFVRAREAEDRRLAEEEIAEATRRDEENMRVATEAIEKEEREANIAANASGEQAVNEGQAATAGKPATKSDAVVAEPAASGAPNVPSAPAEATEKSSEAEASTSSSS